MKISAIRSYSNLPQFSSSKKQQSHSPRTKEQKLTFLSSVGASTLVGATTAAIGSCFISSSANNRGLTLGTIGLAAGVINMALTLPAVIENK